MDNVYYDEIVAGVDEVGRGAIAGPVVAAAVILPSVIKLKDLKDSKKLSPKKRAILADLIKEQALSYSFGILNNNEIDQLNIHQATLVAMERAILSLKIKPSLIIIDGKYIPKKISIICKSIIKGDETEAAIMAASILAKTFRDDKMRLYDKKYPLYGFAQHKGYGTGKHIKILKEIGLCPIYRKSFSPIRNNVDLL